MMGKITERIAIDFRRCLSSLKSIQPNRPKASENRRVQAARAARRVEKRTTTAPIRKAFFYVFNILLEGEPNREVILYPNRFTSLFSGFKGRHCTHYTNGFSI